MFATVPVTLADVMEVRGDKGLTNDEILSILSEGIEPLKILIDNARISSVTNMGLSLDSVYFLPDGSVQLKPLPFEIISERFLPPEYTVQQENVQNSNTKAKLDLSKTYIYAFGALLCYTLECGTQRAVMPSAELYSLLNLMTIRDPNVRLPLQKLAQTTEKLVKGNNVESPKVVLSLFRSIMGSSEFPVKDDDIIRQSSSSDKITGATREDGEEKEETIGWLPQSPSTSFESKEEIRIIALKRDDDHSLLENEPLNFTPSNLHIDDDSVLSDADVFKIVTELPSIRVHSFDNDVSLVNDRSLRVENQERENLSRFYDAMETIYDCDRNFTDETKHQIVASTVSDTNSVPVPPMLLGNETTWLSENISEYDANKSGLDTTDSEVINEEATTARTSEGAFDQGDVAYERLVELESSSSYFPELGNESNVSSNNHLTTVIPDVIIMPPTEYNFLEHDNETGLLDLDEREIFTANEIVYPDIVASQSKTIDKDKDVIREQRDDAESNFDQNLVDAGEYLTKNEATTLNTILRKSVIEDHRYVNLPFIKTVEPNPQDERIQFSTTSDIFTETISHPPIMISKLEKSNDYNLNEEVVSIDTSDINNENVEIDEHDIFASSPPVFDPFANRSRDNLAAIIKHSTLLADCDEGSNTEKPVHFYSQKWFDFDDNYDRGDSFERFNAKIHNTSANADPFLDKAYFAKHIPSLSPSLDSPFNSIDVFSTPRNGQNRKAFAEYTSKSQNLLEKLMPMVPSDFTHPREHRTHVESIRSYHSIDCLYCSPVKRSNARSEKSRLSLPNRTFDEITEDRFGFSRRKKSRSDTIEPAAFDEIITLRRSSQSLDRPKLIDLKYKLNGVAASDHLFASFDNLPPVGSPIDASGRSTPWQTLTTNESKKFADSDSDEENVGKAESLGRKPPKSYSLLNDNDEFVITITDSIPVKIDSLDNSGVLLNTIEESSSDDDEGSKESQMAHLRQPLPPPRKNKQPSPEPPSKVELFKAGQSQKHPNGVNNEHVTFGVGRLSRENSMRIKSGSVRNRPQSFRKQERPNGTTNGGYLDKAAVKSEYLNEQQRNGDTAYSNNSKLPPAHIIPTSVRNMNISGYYPTGKGPEFLYNSRQPSIRLKAPTAQRPKRLFRHLLEKNVLVILLNGQRVDVACRADSTAENIFESVSVHMNLNERHFFGLSVLKDGEHFFLESEQKIEKFAPHGWRNTSRHVYNARIIFTLFLRVKYYPITLDFVKTEQTLHHIFLQLRRDVLDERLRCDKETACRLAALALQVEYGDKTAENMNCFSLNHYLPDRHFADDIGSEDTIKRCIISIWEHYSGTDRRECKIEYVKVCQSQREYGIHFHRLYRSKPSLLLTPSPLGDPDTGTTLWIGIMPRGVIIFEERRGERVPISQHPWHLTATLQFDHKRFIIFPQTDDLAASPKFVYYSDDYKKSMYFVNFAAGQHKFCMKMRTWAATLPAAEKSCDNNSDGRNSLPRPQFNVNNQNHSNVDSDISREASPMAPESVKMRRQHQERAVDAGLVAAYSTPTLDRRSAQAAAHISVLSANDSLINNLNETVSDSLTERINKASVPTPTSPSATLPSDFETFTVTLIKDPHFGLGLTLVDGELQNMKGVYVRAITPGGPAELEGRLQIADRIVSINGESLDGRSRHDAVSMVRNSASEVRLGILRLPPQRSVVNTNAAAANEARLSSSEIRTPIGKKSNRPESMPAFLEASRSSGFSQPPVAANRSLLKNVQKAENSESPENSDDILKRAEDPSAVFAREQDLESSVWLNDTSLAGGVSFHSALASTSDSQNMYSGLQLDSEDDQSNSDPESPRHHPGVKSNMKKSRKASNGSDGIGNNAVLKDKLNKDWTDDIQLNKRGIGWKADDLDLINVTLEKNAAGTLGIQVAGGKGQKKVYIKSLVAEPAISCKNVMPGDHLATVNEQSTRGLNHHEVVNLLKNAKSPVHLGLLRDRNSSAIKKDGGDVSRRSQANEATPTSSVESKETMIETLEILLEKPASGSLGLSLAKSPNTEGIFIRVISLNSVAAMDGRLKVGDRLWKINGESVATSNPTEVVEKLKAAQGFVNLIVKRESNKENGTIS